MKLPSILHSFFFLKFGKDVNKIMKDLLISGMSNKKAKQILDFIDGDSN